MYCVPLLWSWLLYIVMNCLCNSRRCTEGACANSTATWPSSASAVVTLLVLSMCVETGAFIAVCILCYKKEYVVEKIRACLQCFHQTRECCAPDNPCVSAVHLTILAWVLCTWQSLHGMYGLALTRAVPNTNTRSRFVLNSQKPEAAEAAEDL